MVGQIVFTHPAAGWTASYLPGCGYEYRLKVGVHTIWCHFGQFKFVQKDHFWRNTNQSYISIWRVFVLQYTEAIIKQKHHFHFIIFHPKKMVLLSWKIKLFSKRETGIHVILLAKACLWACWVHLLIFNWFQCIDKAFKPKANLQILLEKWRKSLSKSSPALQFYVYGGQSMSYHFYKLHVVFKIKKCVS